MKLGKNILPIILFGTYPLIYLFSENYSDINFSELFLPLVIFVAAPIAILMLTQVILKNITKSSLITSFLVILILYYTYYSVLILEYVDTSQLTVAYISIIFYIIFLTLIIRTKEKLSVYIIFLNVIAISFYIVPVANICIKSYNLYKSPLYHQSKINSKTTNYSENKISGKRDIYYLIFDQYSRNDILKENYNHDNSDFIKFLEEKGFFIADKSYSNYPHTMQSLASSLNMQYINYLSKNEEKNNHDPNALNDLIQNNKVIKFLKSNNYKYIHFGAGEGVTKDNLNADIIYTTYSYKNNQGIILNTIYKQSILPPIVKNLLKRDLLESKIISGRRKPKREGILFQLDRLSEIPQDPQLTFVFMHLLIPHSPYVFDEDGNYVTLEEEKSNTTQINYIRQLKFLNKKLIEVIDKIIAGSHPQPIIIIQSDEGHYPKGYTYKAHSLSKYSAEKLRHKFAIQNAYYFPGTNNEQLYPSISPVNTFRLLFNLYFDEKFEFLEDRHFNTNYWHYYRFLDVTKKLKALDN